MPLTPALPGPGGPSPAATTTTTTAYSSLHLMPPVATFSHSPPPLSPPLPAFQDPPPTASTSRSTSAMIALGHLRSRSRSQRDSTESLRDDAPRAVRPRLAPTSAEAAEDLLISELAVRRGERDDVPGLVFPDDDPAPLASPAGSADVSFTFFEEEEEVEEMVEEDEDEENERDRNAAYFFDDDADVALDWQLGMPHPDRSQNDLDDDDDDSEDDSDGQMILRRMMRLAADGFGPIPSADDADPLLHSFWPSLVGTRPLNPGARRSSSSSTATLRRSPLALSSPTIGVEVNPPHLDDPSSATSPSSFLAPGVLFTGQQIFVPQRRHPTASTSASRPPPSLPRTSYRPPGAPGYSLFSSAAAAVSSPTLRPLGIPLNPPPLYPTSVSQPSSSYATPADDYRTAERRVAAAARALSTSSSAYGDGALSRPSTTEQRTIARLISPRRALDAADPLSPSARARARTHMDVLEIRERMDRISRDVATGGTASGLGVSAKNIDERWAVRVIIQSFCRATQTLTGLMTALGVPNSSSETVTTFFRGEVLDPASDDGLWTKKWGAKQKDDAEYWARLRPFKGLDKEELRVKVADPEWLRRTTAGWILMRWKEQEFINVSPAESTLSIAGWYFIALDRSSGALEGLYYDPVSSPYQKLVLSPATPTAPFTLGSFEFK